MPAEFGTEASPTRRSHPKRLEDAIQKRQNNIEQTPNYTTQQPWWSQGPNEVLEKQIADVASSLESVDNQLRAHSRFEVVQRDLPDGSAACLTVEQVAKRRSAPNPNSAHRTA